MMGIQNQVVHNLMNYQKRYQPIRRLREGELSQKLFQRYPE